MTKMKIIKRCPNCQFQKITGTVSIEEGRYIQKIKCKKCGYANHQDIGNAQRPEETKEDEEDE